MITSIRMGKYSINLYIIRKNKLTFSKNIIIFLLLSTNNVFKMFYIQVVTKVLAVWILGNYNYIIVSIVAYGPTSTITCSF